MRVLKEVMPEMSVIASKFAEMEKIKQEEELKAKLETLKPDYMLNRKERRTKAKQLRKANKKR
jgi:hypothetical protein